MKAVFIKLCGESKVNQHVPMYAEMEECPLKRKLSSLSRERWSYVWPCSVAGVFTGCNSKDALEKGEWRDWRGRAERGCAVTKPKASGPGSEPQEVPDAANAYEDRCAHRWNDTSGCVLKKKHEGERRESDRRGMINPDGCSWDCWWIARVSVTISLIPSNVSVFP